MVHKARNNESCTAVLLMQAGPVHPLHWWFSPPRIQAASLHRKERSKRKRCEGQVDVVRGWRVRAAGGGEQWGGQLAEDGSQRVH